MSLRVSSDRTCSHQISFKTYPQMLHMNHADMTRSVYVLVLHIMQQSISTLTFLLMVIIFCLV